MKKQSTKLFEFLPTAGRKGNMLKTTKALIMASIALCAVSSQATLLAYEGFDTANSIGSDAEAAGVTGSGFSNYTNTNFRMDLEAGLSYLNLEVAGKSAGMDAAVSGTMALQLALDSSITSGTIYFSYLADVTAGTSWGWQVGLDDAIDAAGANLNPEAGLISNSSSNWRPTAGAATVNPSISHAGLHFVVSELNLDTGALTSWFNPTDLTDVAGTAANTASVTGLINDLVSFGFSLGSDEAGTIDEIRIGTTIGDVTPIPEPASLGLIAFFGAAALFIRRRLMI
ncbi:MAG: PEP-CTERM sorting domain-containing protein [Verrucomicrobia bacterium]|nr:PEP-CTERM sorting domain-containing protein [Verrucomicrobiota bacterium]